MGNDEVPAKLPRFTYQLPPDLTGPFIAQMKKEFRETPSDMLTAIARRFFAELAHAEVVGRLREDEQLLIEERRIPNYGTRTEQAEAVQENERKGRQ
jgi:hypothetical protein